MSAPLDRHATTPGIYRGLSSSVIQGYEALRSFDGGYYTDQRIQKMIHDGDHQNHGLDALLASISDSKSDPVDLRETRLSVRRSEGGLYNLGNTCWLNSNLQMLFRSDSSHLALLKDKAKDASDPSSQARCRALLNILELARQPVSRETSEKLHDAIEAFIIDLLDKTVYWGLDAKGVQQDAHEGYQALMAYLSLEDPPSFSFSTVQYRASTRSSSTKSDPEAVLVLNHGAGFSRKAKSMQELVDRSSMIVEEMTGENQLEREDGMGHEDGKRVSYLSLPQDGKLPTSLCLQAPRFVYNKRLKKRVKDTSPIHFENEVRIPYYTPDGKELLGVAVLELSSVVCHLGTSAAGGHYVTYQREANGNFTRYSDEAVVHNCPAASALRDLQTGGYTAKYQVTHYISAVELEGNKYPTIDQVLGVSSKARATSKAASLTPLDEGLGSDASSSASGSDRGSTLTSRAGSMVSLADSDTNEDEGFILVNAPSSPTLSRAKSLKEDSMIPSALAAQAAPVASSPKKKEAVKPADTEFSFRNMLARFFSSSTTSAKGEAATQPKKETPKSAQADQIKKRGSQKTPLNPLERQQGLSLEKATAPKAPPPGHTSAGASTNDYRSYLGHALPVQFPKISTLKAEACARALASRQVTVIKKKTVAKGVFDSFTEGLDI